MSRIEPASQSPSPPTKYGRRSFEGELYPVVEAAYPDCANRGRLAISRLARKLNMSNQTVYRWFFEDRLPLGAANALIEHSGGRLTKHDLFEFLPLR